MSADGKGQQSWQSECSLNFKANDDKLDFNHRNSHANDSPVRLQGLALTKAGVYVQFSKTKAQYLKEFNKLLRTTDILWTKPSELSFFAALGLPIIIAPPIGSQEEYNKGWLLALDAGIPQEDPEQAAEWLFDWLNSGFLAKAAMAGYREGFKFGTFNIEQLVSGHPEKMKLVETVSPY